MSSIKQSIISCLSDNAQDEDQFILELDKIAQKEGDQIFQELLNLLTHLEFDVEDAKENWKNILKHRNSMRSALARQINLSTAICDYFLTVNKSFSQPTVVELDVFEQATHSSKHDHLTGLYNRAYFDETLSNELKRASRYNTEFSIMFLDLDDFKKVNDTYGHLAGDLTLKTISKLVMNEKRAEDTVARYGGEELIIILPETGKANTLIKGERICKIVENTPINFNGKSISVTLSGGIASYPADGKNATQLIHAADQALYDSKAHGKNQMSLFSNNKRQFLRVDFAGPVMFQRLGMMSSQNFSAKGKDLSLSGILFESAEPIEIGSKIEIKVPIPSKEKPTILIGAVMRLEKYGDSYDIGVSFLQIDSRERNELTQFLERYLEPRQD